MKEPPIKAVVLIGYLSVWPLMVGLTGCAGDRPPPSTGHGLEDQRTAERGYGQSTDQGIQDSRTTERVREALAAGTDYRYDRVEVIARDGVVQLSGFVNTNAQRTRAGEVASKVTGVKSVENNLAVKD